jgi:hypothetical protein
MQNKVKLPLVHFGGSWNHKRHEMLRACTVWTT